MLLLRRSDTLISDYKLPIIVDRTRWGAVEHRCPAHTHFSPLLFCISFVSLLLKPSFSQCKSLRPGVQKKILFPSFAFKETLRQIFQIVCGSVFPCLHTPRSSPRKEVLASGLGSPSWQMSCGFLWGGSVWGCRSPCSSARSPSVCPALSFLPPREAISP